MKAGYVFGEALFFARNGDELTADQWAQLMPDCTYKRVAEDTVGPYWVSTVWLGINHRFVGDGPPIIFETMVFLVQDDGERLGSDEFGQWRYCTEEQALQGHQEVVTLVRATTLDVDDLTEGLVDGNQ